MGAPSFAIALPVVLVAILVIIGLVRFYLDTRHPEPELTPQERLAQFAQQQAALRAEIEGYWQNRVESADGRHAICTGYLIYTSPHGYMEQYYRDDAIAALKALAASAGWRYVNRTDTGFEGVTLYFTRALPARPSAESTQHDAP